MHWGEPLGRSWRPPGRICSDGLVRPAEYRLIFTSGGSGSNHMAVFGLTGPAGSDVVVSSIEHPSVIEPAKCLRQQGVDVQVVPADRTGVWRIDRLADVVDSRTSLVSLMLANNETGVVQPIDRAVEICRAAGVPLPTDAVQAVVRSPSVFRIGCRCVIIYSPQISWAAWHWRAAVRSI